MRSQNVTKNKRTRSPNGSICRKKTQRTTTRQIDKLMTDKVSKVGQKRTFAEKEPTIIIVDSKSKNWDRQLPVTVELKSEKIAASDRSAQRELSFGNASKERMQAIVATKLSKRRAACLLEKATVQQTITR